MTIKRFLSIYLCSVFIAITSGVCYFIDGTEAENRFTCSDLNTVNASMCCESDTFVDSCMDGICVVSVVVSPGQYDDEKGFWRDSCSDPTWRDPACVKMASCEKSRITLSFNEQEPNVRVY